VLTGDILLYRTSCTVSGMILTVLTDSSDDLINEEEDEISTDSDFRFPRTYVAHYSRFGSPPPRTTPSPWD
jgi:hypothetical protein